MHMKVITDSSPANLNAIRLKGNHVLIRMP